MTGHKIWIKNARVLDPSRGLDSSGSRLVSGSRIAAFSPEEARNAEQVIDAKGCLVTPGLVDFHIHLARCLTDTGVYPDLMALPNGITSAVDAGSCGTAAMEGFVRSLIPLSEITIKAFLNVSPVGVTTERHAENPDPASWDVERIEYLFERYGEHLLGLKLRLGKGFSDGFGIRSLQAARAIACQLKKPLCVHLTNSEVPYSEVLALLCKDDILCHCYQGLGEHTILDDSGHILPSVREARSRGVIFDVASGRINYNLDVMRKAYADGFFPDIISTDAVSTSVYNHKLFHLLYVLSRHLAMGGPILDVFAACTSTPARLMGLENSIGTLAPGAQADIAIFKIREKPLVFPDQYGNTLEGTQLLIPQLTIKAGRVVYEHIDFAF
jgi:predicted amidohydrolase